MFELVLRGVALALPLNVPALSLLAGLKKNDNFVTVTQLRIIPQSYILPKFITKLYTHPYIHDYIHGPQVVVFCLPMVHTYVCEEKYIIDTRSH